MTQLPVRPPDLHHALRFTVLLIAATPVWLGLPLVLLFVDPVFALAALPLALAAASMGAWRVSEMQIRANASSSGPFVTITDAGITLPDGATAPMASLRGAWARSSTMSEVGGRQRRSNGNGLELRATTPSGAVVLAAYGIYPVSDTLRERMLTQPGDQTLWVWGDELSRFIDTLRERGAPVDA